MSDMTVTEARNASSGKDGEKANGQLHLPDLVVRGFRGLEDLHISSLGRVTMITGKNSVGKTSVLDAVRVYAARGSFSVLTNLLEEREEFANAREDAGHLDGIDLAGLFHDWEVTDSSKIRIGSTKEDNQLMIEVVDVTEEHLKLLGVRYPEVYARGNKMLSSRFNGSFNNFPWMFPVENHSIRMTYSHDQGSPLIHRRLRQQEAPVEVPCVNFGPGLPDNLELADTWDEILFSDDEKKALKALRDILGGDVTRIAAVGGSRGRLRGEPRLIAERSNLNRQFPLKAFGDGALRMIGIALALVRARDGFLLIDEAENGFHYSIQSDFWRMVLSTAQENNVQVIATTHSADCVRSFARAAMENQDAEGALVRMNRFDGVLYADLYSESQVANAATHSVDLR